MIPSRESISLKQLDRLIDGELSEADRLDLVNRLEDTPDGWKRCALAFLEHQSWQEAFGPMVGPSRDSKTAQIARQPQSRPQATSLRRRIFGVVVAVMIGGVAFAAGFFVRGGETLNERPGRLANDSVPAEIDATSNAIVEEDAGEEAPEPTESATDEELQPTIRVDGVAQIGDDPNLTAPVYTGPGIDEEWLRNQPQYLPAAAQRRLQERGWQVQQERQVITVKLSDGQRLLIPIDSVQYQFIGQQIY